MPLAMDKHGEVVHIPKRRDVFQFDEEVAAVFDSMAPRSIPLYNEAHRLHVSLLHESLRPGAVVADIGSSTGHLFRAIEKQQGVPFERTGIDGIALDLSSPMMERLSKEFPSVYTVVADIADAPDLPKPADLLFCLYVLQFIHPFQKKAALDWIVRNTKVGGCMVLGQKEDVGRDWMADRFSDEYYKFRRDNGYTQEEIDAKTEALKGSMWPILNDDLLWELRDRDVVVYETSRWLQFSTLVGIRRG